MQSSYFDQIQQPLFAIKYQQKINNKLKKTYDQTLKLSLNIGKTFNARQHNFKRYTQNHSRYRSIDTSDIGTGKPGQSNGKNNSLRKESLSSVHKKQENALIDSSKEYQKIPLEFSDEAPWYGLKGRLVYRGHTPKNSYYLMVKLKQCQQNVQIEGHEKASFENDLEFDSKFQSGNLQAALRVSKKEYWLFMREDTNTLGLRQWFFFEVVSNHPMKITFRIYKFSKKYSLYSQQMRPYIKEKGQQWSQKGENVSYEYDAEMKCFYLQFSFNFTAERERILVAGMPPYTYNRLLRYLTELESSRQVQIRHIGKSLGGLGIPLIHIPSFPHPGTAEARKRAIIIIGRTHPAQTCSNFSIESIIPSIIGCAQLRSSFDFFIVPMVNPDGVFVGNHRTGLSGVDLNRKFGFNLKQSERQMFPEVETVKELVRSVNRSHRIQFLMDLHGHSAKKNIFAYGEKEQVNSDHYLKSRIIPKLLAEHLDAFKYDHCLFQSYRQKKTTARVYFAKKYQITAITFEQSYGQLDHSLIRISDWRSFGTELVAVLREYTASYMEKQNQMGQILKAEIEKDSISQAMKEKKSDIEKPSQSQAVKLKTEDKHEKKEVKEPSVFPFKPKEQDEEDVSEQSSSLKSGDQELQNTEEGVEQLRIKMFVVRQQTERQSMTIPDTSIELQEITRPRASIMHEQKMPVISRILRMQQKRRKSGDLIDILTHNSIKEELKSMRLKIRQHKIKLPNIIKFAS